MYLLNLMAVLGTGTSVATATLAIGSMVLFILGGIFVVVGIVTLLKKNSSNRP